MRWRLRLVIVAGLVLVAGCGGLGYCTEVGCIAGVDVQVSQAFAVELLPVEVTTCADEVCEAAVNGAGCGPVCYGAAFTYPGSGTELDETS
jgi:hypothetical protein